MKIRRLEIQGFKSFADRTVLKFGDGITGVVGPNGCGKSNIVDAIRWVMGEQSAKHLRGLGMQDIIFAGCESRGPAGMAEVSITFKNDGALVPPEYQHLEEIQVTRRLYRDGTSEYAINQVNCRLRDILDLFMGTGIGKNAYAIIEQGRIGLIVTARPEERRSLIEDAAGVSRYKARRKQAERRIAATEQNLLRVNDLVSELEGRLKTLEGQAKKAEKYKRLRTELKDLELHSSAHKRLELDASERFETTRAQALQQKIDGESHAFTEEEETISEATESFSTEESELRRREAAAYENEKGLDLARQNIEFITKEGEKLQERLLEATAERTALLEEQRKLREELEETEAMETSLDAGADEETRTLEAKEVALEVLKEQISERKSTLDSDKAAMVEHLTAVAERKNALENMDRRSEELRSRAKTSEEDAQKARDRSAEAQTQLEKLEAHLVEKTENKVQLETHRNEQEADVRQLQIKLDSSEDQLQKLREQMLGQRSRLKSLEKISANYEGCSDAVRSVMQRGQDGVHGLVADLLTSEPKFETAVEAVLGERLQSVVVSEQQDGLEAGQYLRTGGHGRSTFVPLDLRLDHAPWWPRHLESRESSIPPTSNPPENLQDTALPSLASASTHEHEGDTERPTETTVLPSPIDDTHPPAEAHSLIPQPASALNGNEISGVGEWMEEEDRYWPNLHDPSVCGRMVDLVRTKPGYEHVAQALVGDVVIVESIEKAREMWVSNGHRKTLVTLNGEVLDPMGIFTGGSSSGVSEGLLAQKREIEELRTQVTDLEQKIGQETERKHALKEELEQTEARLASLTQELQQNALDVVSLERDIESVRRQAAREIELAERAEADRAEIQSNLEGLIEEQTTTRSELDRLAESKDAAESRVSEAAMALAELEIEAKNLGDSITTLKVEVAANHERRENSRKSITRISGRLDDIDARLDKLSTVSERSRVELSDGKTKVEAEQTRVQGLAHQVSEERETIDALRAKLEVKRTDLKERETALQKRRSALDTIKTKLNKSDMKIREYQIARDNLQSQIRDRYQIELDEILTDFHVLAPPNEEHLQKTKKLRRQLSDIGAINLTAIEEFASVKARYDHLAAQKLDLETAIEALKAAIRKINKTSQERFIEAFRLVNEKFQQVFPKVFNGGRSALVLTDENDPLESGIEIMAQPPGKKLQSVNLLSGGEKALTAVSLIFGIFLIKPTPFCLLDEVDAPLDEANVGRYNNMLQEMAHISQFVLITHNKRTMELPDRLYGVTMETPGVSKIVPVDVIEDKPSSRNLRAV